MSAVEEKKTKGMFFFALLCACLGVWGYVFYQIAHGFSQMEDPFEALSLTPSLELVSSSAPRRPGPAALYNGDFRDPFAPPAALFAPPPSSPRRRVKPPPPEPPPFLLSGVVDETALLHGEDGSAYVVRAGEHAGSVQILTVQPDRVVVRYQGRSHTLHLAQ